MIRLDDIVARIGRLEELSKGLAREVGVWDSCEDPLLSRERKAYLRGILDALTGVDTARVTLDKVVKRMTAPAGPRRMD